MLPFPDERTVTNMTDDRFKSEEQLAKEEAYREYLRLRQEAPKVSITETPYGASEMRRRQKEAAERRAYEESRREAEQHSSGRRHRRKPSRDARSSSAEADKTRTRRMENPERAAQGRTEARQAPASRAGAGTAARAATGNSSRAAAGTSAGVAAGTRSGQRSQPRPERTGRTRTGSHPEAASGAGNASASAPAGKPPRKKKFRLEREPSPYKRSGSTKSRPLKIAIIVILAIIIGTGVLGMGALAAAASTLGSIGDLDINENALGISSQAKSALKDYKNIAVLGVDTRDMNDDSESRSDAMVVVSINKETNEVKMFSVFRDTLLYLDDKHGLDKITHAYSYGGAEASLYALNRNLDLNIDKTVVINWKMVAEMIDALGGIEIDVQESELDELNKYIKSTAKGIDGDKTEVEEPGKQTLNGTQAVTYARIRKDAVTGDYRRNERMKIVMATTFQKAKQADLFTLKKICDNALPQAKTNMSTGEMMGMALKFRKYNVTSSTTGWPYTVGAWIGDPGNGMSAWYGPPQTLASNVTELYEKFFGIEDYEPTEDVQSISDDIANITGLY